MEEDKIGRRSSDPRMHIIEQDIRDINKKFDQTHVDFLKLWKVINKIEHKLYNGLTEVVEKLQKDAAYIAEVADKARQHAEKSDADRLNDCPYRKLNEGDIEKRRKAGQRRLVFFAVGISFFASLPSWVSLFVGG